MIYSTEKIWNEFYMSLRGYILKRVSDIDEAEDILQDIFIKIHKKIDTLKEEKKLKYWLYAITHNAIIDHYRTRRENISLGDEISEKLDIGEEKFERDELNDCLNIFIKNLPEKDKQALKYTDLTGHTQGELAHKLGISLSGAKSRVQRARSKLRDMFLECCNTEIYDTIASGCYCKK